MEDKVQKALALYREGKLSVKEAKRLSGLSLYEWAKACIAAGLPWNIVEITPEDLDHDIEVARRAYEEATT